MTLLRLKTTHLVFLASFLIPILRFVWDFRLFCAIVLSYAIISGIFYFIFSPLLHFSLNTWKIKKKTASMLFIICVVGSLIFLIPNVLMYFVDYSKDVELFGSTISLLFGPPFVYFFVCAIFYSVNLKFADGGIEETNIDGT